MPAAHSPAGTRARPYRLSSRWSRSRRCSTCGARIAAAACWPADRPPGAPVATRRGRGPRARGIRNRAGRSGVLVALIVVVVASLPFAFNERNGVLGEGIYTNDQAAQLYWTDWLQHGVGPEPNAVRFGYPTGPQSVAATVAEATNSSLQDAFNGLLLAIPVLTALTALGVMGGLSPARRVIAASLDGLPFLAASFLAQSAFKETAMALLVLAFAVTLRDLAFLNRNPDYGGGAHPRRALVIVVLILLDCVERLRLQHPGPGLVRARPADLARAGAAHRWHADRSGRGAGRDDAAAGAWSSWRRARPRRGRLLGVAALGFVEQGGHGAGVGGPAHLARVPRRGARDLAGGRLPDRPRRGRPAPTRPSRSGCWRRHRRRPPPSGAAIGAWSPWARAR